MTWFLRIFALSAGKLRHTDPPTIFRDIEPDFLTFLFPALVPQFP
jgi:hypothetical protein